MITFAFTITTLTVLSALREEGDFCGENPSIYLEPKPSKTKEELQQIEKDITKINHIINNPRNKNKRTLKKVLQRELKNLKEQKKI